MHKSRGGRLHQCRCAQCRRHPYSQVAAEHRAINRVMAGLDERNRRRFAGLLALQAGPRHISLVAQITGLSRMTIYRGLRELQHTKAQEQIRTPGAGRLPVEKNNQASWQH